MSSAHSWAGCSIAPGGPGIAARWLRDQHGRTLLVRGVNMSGNSKLPTSPPAATASRPDAFFDHRNVSFVGRPFPLADAPEHFERLRAWGLTFARLLVPWEAIEHSGPGIYDEQYIEYLINLLKIAPSYGIKFFIDPHQDTWSRFSGGSGAPGWTFEVVGMDITNFEITGAALLHHFKLADEAKMLWPTNYIKLASATMFTVFFAGDELSPNLTYNGQSPQQFLQSHFCNAYAHLARRLREAGVDSVVGFEVLNEPHPGYIGIPSMFGFDTMKDLHFDNTPCALESFALGSGIPQHVGYWVKSWPWPTRKANTKLVNSQKKSAWLPGRSCIWRMHGVWDLDSNDKPVVLKPDYFCLRRDGSKINFNAHCYAPFLKRYARAIREADPDMIVFFEPLPNEDPPELIDDTSPELEKIVFAPHWYDLKAVFSKSFNGFITHDVQGLSRGTKNVLQASYFGLTGAKRNYQSQIANIVSGGTRRVGLKPCLFGEVGIPMDINEKRAFETGDYAHHTNFLDAVISAMESNLVNFTLWNYNPHNDNIYGDHWNGEDFSIFSRSNSKRPSLAGPKARSRQSSTLDAPRGSASHSINNSGASDTTPYDTPPNMSPSSSNNPQLLSQSESPTAGVDSTHTHASSASGGASLAPSSSAVTDTKSASRTNDHQAHSQNESPGMESHGSMLTPTPSPSRAAEKAQIAAESPTTTQSKTQKSVLDHVDGQGSPYAHSSPATPSRTAALTPITPFDITELCYTNMNEFDHTHVGGRALDAVIRPYAAKIAGEPLKMRFDLSTLEFELYFVTPRIRDVGSQSPRQSDSTDADKGNQHGDGCRHTSACKSIIANTTEIYVPNFHYGAYDSPEVSVSDGTWTYDRKRQTLSWTIDPCRHVEPWTDELPYALWAKWVCPETLPPPLPQTSSTSLSSLSSSSSSSPQMDDEVADVNVHSIRIGVPSGYQPSLSISSLASLVWSWRW